MHITLFHRKFYCKRMVRIDIIVHSFVGSFTEHTRHFMSSETGILRDGNKLSFCITDEKSIERDDERFRGLVYCSIQKLYFCRLCGKSGRMKSLLQHLRTKSHKENGKAFLVCFGEQAIVEESIEVT